MDLYPGKQLFIDDFFIESMVGARRVLHQPQKLTAQQPLEVVFDRPWERGEVRPGSIVYDESNHRFRMYYKVDVDGEARICALDSSDAQHWERPELGLVEFEGAKRNNITNCPAEALAILWDPHARDEDFRWKRIDNKPMGQADDGQPQWQAYHSRDGYDWRPYPPGPHNRQTMLFNFGARPESFGGGVDPDAPYVYYTQRGSGRATRVLGRRDSADFLNWSGLRTVIDLDLADPPGTEFYSASTDVANRSEGGLHTLMLHVYQTDLAEPYVLDTGYYWGEEPPKATPIRLDGLVETQLAVSRDTMSWIRYRQPFLPRGEAGAWDWGMVYGSAPIRHGDQLLFAYNACNLTHSGRSARLFEAPFLSPPIRGKGLAVLRPDGYVSVEAQTFAPGVLTTHRFRQESGGAIGVNVDAAAGELRYELVQDTGDPVPGYGVADCDPIRCDTLAGQLSWRRRHGWPGVTAEQAARFPKLGKGGVYVKLRFYIAPGTRLYSVTLDPPEVAMWRARVTGGVD